MDYKSAFYKERDEFHTKSIKTGAYWTFPIIAMEMFHTLDQLNRKRNRESISWVMNYYHIATTTVCIMMFMLAYCKKKEQLILPGYIFIAISTVIRMLDFDH